MIKNQKFSCLYTCLDMLQGRYKFYISKQIVPYSIPVTFTIVENPSKSHVAMQLWAQELGGNVIWQQLLQKLARQVIQIVYPFLSKIQCRKEKQQSWKRDFTVLPTEQNFFKNLKAVIERTPLLHYYQTADFNIITLNRERTEFKA